MKEGKYMKQIEIFIEVARGYMYQKNKEEEVEGRGKLNTSNMTLNV